MKSSMLMDTDPHPPFFLSGVYGGISFRGMILDKPRIRVPQGARRVRSKTLGGRESRKRYGRQWCAGCLSR